MTKKAQGESTRMKKKRTDSQLRPEYLKKLAMIKKQEGRCFKNIDDLRKHIEEEGDFDLSDSAKEQLKKARKTPRSQYISQKEMERKFLKITSIRYKGKEFNLNIEEGNDGYLIAEVVGIPGCRTQARSYKELMKRIKEAIALSINR